MTDNRNIWDEFDSEIDLEGLKKDIKDASENGGNYKEVPNDDYEVEINKLELTKSKNNDPMVTVWFKILKGEYKGSFIFMNQVVTKGFQLHIVNTFLRSLDSSYNIEFLTYAQYANLLMDIMEEITGKYEYALHYGKNNKGYNVFEITEVFELE